MIGWIVAVVGGLLIALAQYARREARRGPATITAALCRATAATIVIALLLDVPRARGHVPPPRPALDVSESMLRGGGVWTAALDSLRAIQRGNGARDSILLFGDSARELPAGAAAATATALSATDPASTLRPVIDQSLAQGRGVAVITDGELDDPAAARDLPAGSRLIVLNRAAKPDLAVSALDAPRAAVSGDSARIAVSLVAGGAGAHAGSLVLTLDGRAVARAALQAMPPIATRVVNITAVLSAPAGPRALAAAVTDSGDAEPRNDTLTVAVEMARAASAAFVSTSPDFDARFALAVLRGALRIPTRGFFRVAPGAWRVDGTLGPVSEADVRAALHDAPMAIIHGDTAVFGPPRTATIGPLALLVPPATDQGEWYPSSAPASPLSPALTDIPWDSLPPISVAAVPQQPHSADEWQGLVARLARGAEARPVIVGVDAPRRVVIIPASGMWRWQFRSAPGGISSDAFTAFWGSIFDWLAAERADQRAALPEDQVVRAGQPIRWRRSGATARDSSVHVMLMRRGAGGDVKTADSLTLSFPSGVSTVTTPPLAEGIYDVREAGGAALIAVNPSSEWLPRRAAVRSGNVGGSAPPAPDARIRSAAWLYVAVVLLLCIEWMLRRRAGLR